MRALSAYTEARLRRPDPQARTFVEAVAAIRDDRKVTPDDWNAADSLTGLTVQDDGPVRLAGSLEEAAARAVAERSPVPA